MIFPLVLAGAIWIYNGIKIAERLGSKKSDENSNCTDDKGNENTEENKNITISNSADAIRFIKSQQKSSGQRTRAGGGGERYGK